MPSWHLNQDLEGSRRRWRASLHRCGSRKEKDTPNVRRYRSGGIHTAPCAEGRPMSVYKSKKSPYNQYDYQTGGHRFHGSTECTARKDAEKFESVERDRAKTLVKESEISPLYLPFS